MFGGTEGWGFMSNDDIALHTWHCIRCASMAPMLHPDEVRAVLL